MITNDVYTTCPICEQLCMVTIRLGNMACEECHNKIARQSSGDWQHRFHIPRRPQNGGVISINVLHLNGTVETVHDGHTTILGDGDCIFAIGKDKQRNILFNVWDFDTCTWGQWKGEQTSCQRD